MAVYPTISVNMMAASCRVDLGITEQYSEKMIIPAYEISESFYEMTLIRLNGHVPDDILT